MENEVGNGFLPIGTVVLLKNATKPLMITGYATLPRGEIYDQNGKVENKGIMLYDYCGYFYPEGLIASDKVFAFNHSQIEKVYFKGYESQEFKELSEKMTKEIEKIKSQITEITKEISSQLENKQPEQQETQIEHLTLEGEE